MPVIYEVKIVLNADQKTYHLRWRNLVAQTENSFAQANHGLTREEVERLWLKPEYHHALGQKLFRFLDGDGRHLQRSLDEAAKLSEPLTLHLRAGKEIADWPFELLAQDGAFLLPNRLHLLRQVSDWGAQKITAPANCPLRLLFMACSALGVEPELDFEREEETIFRVTEKLAIGKQVYGEQHPNIASSLNNLEAAWDALSEHQKAIGYFEQALAIDRAVYGDNHPSVATDLNNLGAVYFTLGEKQKAKKYFQPAHAIFNQFLGPEHPNTKTVAEWLVACE